ncbi:MAG: chemotaxis protein CheX [Gemmatimonas sp.]
MEQSLSQATTATFEELVLICPDTKLSDQQSEALVDVAVSVSFNGPLSGRLVVRASSEILPGIAENMLGADGDYPFAVQRDALGEIANVICGNLLPRIGGAEAVFVLSAPHEYSTGGEPHRCTPVARTSIGVERGRVVSQLLLSDESLSVLGLSMEAA